MSSKMNLKTILSKKSKNKATPKNHNSNSIFNIIKIGCLNLNNSNKKRNTEKKFKNNKKFSLFNNNNKEEKGKTNIYKKTNNYHRTSKETINVKTLYIKKNRK